MSDCLKGLMVLDLTRVLAGPYATMTLADMGADVIKIEEPKKGDDSRQFGPFIKNESAYFMGLNRNKRSVTLNLKEPAAVEIFKKLIARADVLVENYRPGTMEKLGLGYDVLKQINPRLVYAACSGFGHSGPWSQRPAYDVIVQGAGGIMSITGQPDGEPTRVGASIGDIVAGLFTAVGILQALYNRDKTDKGQKVDVAMFDCQLAILENAIARYFVNGESPTPIGNRHPSITPFETFATKTRYFILAIGNDNQWAKFCRVVGREELIHDHRFSTNPKRTKNHEELRSILAQIFLSRTCEEWLEIIEGEGIPCGPINKIEDVVKHPQTIARDMIMEMEHPIAGNISIVGIPIKMSRTPGNIVKPAPYLSQHTEEILKELGYTNEKIIELKRQGAI